MAAVALQREPHHGPSKPQCCAPATVPHVRKIKVQASGTRPVDLDLAPISPSNYPADDIATTILRHGN